MIINPYRFSEAGSPAEAVIDGFKNMSARSSTTYTPTAGCDMLILAVATEGGGSGVAATSATYAGTALTLAHHRAGGDQQCDLLFLEDPLSVASSGTLNHIGTTNGGTVMASVTGASGLSGKTAVNGTTSGLSILVPYSVATDEIFIVTFSDGHNHTVTAVTGIEEIMWTEFNSICTGLFATDTAATTGTASISLNGLTRTMGIGAYFNRI